MIGMTEIYLVVISYFSIVPFYCQLSLNLQFCRDGLFRSEGEAGGMATQH